MIGLSISMCIRDIMSGDKTRIIGREQQEQVMESDVTKIIAGTCCRTEADWEALYDAYRRVYWRSDAFEAAAAIELIKRLRAQGKIEQPRLDDPEYYNHSINHWVVDGGVSDVRQSKGHLKHVWHQRDNVTTYPTSHSPPL